MSRPKRTPDSWHITLQYRGGHDVLSGVRVELCVLGELAQTSEQAVLHAFAEKLGPISTALGADPTGWVVEDIAKSYSRRLTPAEAVEAMVARVKSNAGVTP